MSKLKHLLNFTGGHNDIVEPELIGDNQVSDSQNYEVLGEGGLTRRYDPDTYSAALNTYLGTTLALVKIYTISPPMYPQVKPSDMTGEFVMAVYGRDASVFRMYLVYEIAGGWNHSALSGLAGSGIEFDYLCAPEFSIGNDRMIITDGVNRAYYIAIDAEGDIQAGMLGIPSPTNKAYMIPSTGYGAEAFTTDSNNSISAPGLVQVNYTVVTKDGHESNPSPLSDTLDLQWFNFDSDGNDDRWIAKVNISNLTVPDVQQDLLDELKYFKIYIRTIRNSGGTVPHNLEFVQRFDIIDKSVTSATVAIQSGNAYAVTLESSAGEIVSYENDIAPIATHNAQNGGVIMLAGTKSQSMIGYPWKFGYYIEIKLNNQNAETFIDALVTIEIDDTATALSELDWDFYLSIPGTSKTLDKNKHKLRMYDTDGITPLQVAYNDDGVIGNVVVAYVKIPQLSPGVHSIYLCFSNSDINKAGVSNTNYQEYYAGRWMPITSASTYVQSLMFTGGEKLRMLNSLVVAQCENFVAADEVPNKANHSNPGDLTSMTQQSVAMGNVPVLDLGVSPPSWWIDTESLVAANDITGALKFDVSRHGVAPKKGVMTFKWNFTPSIGFGAGAGLYVNIMSLTDSAGEKLIGLWLYEDGTDYNFAAVVYHGAGTQVDLFTIGAVAHGSNTKKEYSIVFSWDDDAATASLYLYDETQAGTPYDHEEISLTEKMTSGVLKYLWIGKESTIDGFARAEMDQINVFGGKYLSAITDSGKNAAWNLINFMPLMSTMVGYDKTNDQHNQNIEWGTIKEYEIKDEGNKIAWSDVNGVNIPDLYSKKLREPVSALIPAPSFLQFQYENTMVLFTRNTINRFLMSGPPSTWPGDPNRLVKEKENYGLYSEESLTVAGDNLFWLSENGIIRWSPRGFDLLSKHTISIPLVDQYNEVEDAAFTELDTDRQTSGIYSQVTEHDGWYVAVDSGAERLVVYSFESDTLTYESEIALAKVTGAWSDGTYLYACSSLSAGGIRAYSIDSSGVITHNHTRALGNGSYDVWGDGTFIYVAVSGTGIQSFTYAGAGFTLKDTHDVGGTYVAVWGDGTTVFALVRGGGYRLQAYTVDGAGNFTWIDDTSSLAGADEGYKVWGDGTYVYVANNIDGLRAYKYDAGAGSFDYISGIDDGGTYTGVYCFNDIIYCATGTGGIKAYTMVAGVLTATQLGSSDNGSYGVYVDNAGIYFARQSTGLTVYNYARIDHFFNNYSGHFQPINNQYMLHDLSTGKSYIYHLLYDVFYKFSGIAIDSGIPRVLSAGSTNENINLMIRSDNEIDKYPGDTLTTESAYIVTKWFDHLRAVFNRWQFNMTGSNVEVETTVIDSEGLFTYSPELMPHQADREFTGGDNWINIDLPVYSTSGSLDVGSNHTGNQCECPVASMPTTIGDRYRLVFDVASLVDTWIFKSYDSAQTLGTVSSDGLKQTFEWIAETTGGLRILSGTGSAVAVFDNFSLKTVTYKTDTKTDVLANKWKWITNGKNLGRKIYFTITNPDSILSGIYEYLTRGAR